MKFKMQVCIDEELDQTDYNIIYQDESGEWHTFALFGDCNSSQIFGFEAINRWPQARLIDILAMIWSEFDRRDSWSDFEIEISC